MSRERGKVLVVDDIEENRDILSRVLSRERYEVLVAEDSTKAIKAVRESQPTLVLLDINLPDLNGFEACKQILSLQPSTAIIFVSARTDQIDKLTAFELGAVDYITKPYDLNEVLQRVNTHMTLRSLQVETEKQNQQLKEQFEALKKAERVRDVITQTLVHDLRTPLATIVTALDYTIQELPGEFKNTDLSLARVAATRLTNMINNLLDIRKLNTMDSMLDLERCDLIAVIESAVEQTKLITSKHKVSVHRPEAESFIFGDPHYLQRTFENLILNAAKAMRGSGAIRIAVVDQMENVAVSVEDQGKGIASDMIEKVFDEFVSESESGPPSFGLGLTLCNLVVEQHKGRIQIESLIDAGTTVTVELPKGSA